MTKEVLKQTAGIDVASKKLDVSLGRLNGQLVTEIYAYRAFDNTEKGFMAMTLWVKKHTESSVPVRFVMEATGVYHERLARHLSDKQYALSIVMPNKITNFFKTLEVKSVTDKSMSAAIAMFGLEKNLDNWIPPRKAYRSLRQLTRERDQLIEERTMAKNHLHAEEAEAYPNEDSVGRIKARIKMINGQLKEILSEITAIIKQDAEVSDAMSLVTSIPGIGTLAAATILAETDGFALIENKRQLSSYAGLDVKLKDSGSSIHAKPQISKRGNRYLRKVMHMPALAAIRHTERYKAVFIRIVNRSGIKMKGVVAVQRMLLELAYTIHKSKNVYREDYLQEAVKQDSKS